MKKILVLFLLAFNVALYAQTSFPGGVESNGVEMNEWVISPYSSYTGLDIDGAYAFRRSYFPSVGSGRLEVGPVSGNRFIFYNGKVLYGNSTPGISPGGPDFIVQGYFSATTMSTDDISAETGRFGPSFGAIPTGYSVAVNGKIICEELTVQLSTNWPDFVFGIDYRLRSLEEVDQYIKEHNHLPDVPSAEEVEENGVNSGEMDAILLRKIEELTLYLIELKKENERLRSDIEK